MKPYRTLLIVGAVLATNLVAAFSRAEEFDYQNICAQLLARAQSPDRYRGESDEPAVFNLSAAQANTAVHYTRTVAIPPPRDQCTAACSYFSVANFLEAMDDFAAKAKGLSRPPLKISANGLWVDDKVWRYESLLGWNKRRGFIRSYMLAGGYPDVNVIRSIEGGVFLEGDYPSDSTVRTRNLVDDLNKLLITARDQFRPRALPASEQKRLKEVGIKLVQSAFGPTPDKRRVQLDSLKGFEILKLDFRNKRIDLHRPPSRMKPEASKKVKESHLWNTAESEIRAAIDEGRPALIFYNHISRNLDHHTGIYSPETENGAGDTEAGHVAIIIGYRLGQTGEIDMLKIQNSRTTAPIIHMTADYMREQVWELIFLK